MLELKEAIIRQGGFALAADLTLNSGDRLALIGPSGAGKSTLLAGIAGFADTSGQLCWNSAPLVGVPGDRPVSMLFQDNNLFPHLTAFQNVGLGISPSLSLTESDQAKVASALGEVGLAGMEDRKPAQLSGGQQSRVAIARMLVMARPIMLLDEPFSALGPKQRLDMLELVCSVADRLGAVLIVVTHDPAEARALGGMVSFVDEGTVSPPRDAGAFFADPPDGLAHYIGG